MTGQIQPSKERIGYTLLVACMLAPVLVQGLWRPLQHFWGAAGSATVATLSALAVALIQAILHRVVPGRGPRWAAGGLWAGLLAVGFSQGAAGVGAVVAVTALSAWLFDWLPARLPEALDGLGGRHRALAVLYVLVALLNVVSVARVSSFIGDPSLVDYQAIPGNKFTEVHSCLSAYERALDLARSGEEDLYADHWWAGSNGLPPLPAGVENPYTPFELDNFNYPPTFLVVATPLALLEGDFLAQRALWFGLNGLVAAAGLWMVARWLGGGPAAHRVLLLAPFFWGSVPVLLVLQVGNFHLAATVLSVLAMVAFERQRAVAGGALLATAILSKISPGILGILLLVQRRFRESAVAAGFGLLLLGLALLGYGSNPLLSFLSTSLPHLSSGAAFPFMQTDAGLITNMSPFGIPFKLNYLGVDVGDPWQLAPKLSRFYTVGLVGVAVLSARRGGDRRVQALRWMGLLVLASLQSPFSPAYSTLALLWGTTLLSVEVRRTGHAVALLLLWPGLLLSPPGWSVAAVSVLSMAQTALAITVAGWLALRSDSRPPEPIHPG
ncbi:MAG TPA: glycosyltransferase family 87 protein [Myxococcota bacterium]|nr:glycosyltransferase family 87 protein [Myxococcota bacterium]